MKNIKTTKTITSAINSCKDLKQIQEVLQLNDISGKVADVSDTHEHVYIVYTDGSICHTKGGKVFGMRNEFKVNGKLIKLSSKEFKFGSHIKDENGKVKFKRSSQVVLMPDFPVSVLTKRIKDIFKPLYTEPKQISASDLATTYKFFNLSAELNEFLAEQTKVFAEQYKKEIDSIHDSYIAAGGNFRDNIVIEPTVGTMKVPISKDPRKKYEVQELIPEKPNIPNEVLITKRLLLESMKEKYNLLINTSHIYWREYKNLTVLFDSLRGKENEKELLLYMWKLQKYIDHFENFEEETWLTNYGKEFKEELRAKFLEIRRLEAKVTNLFGKYTHLHGMEKFADI